MGGINSGRRPGMWDARPQVEDALILDISLLRAYNAFTTGVCGVMHWADGRGCMNFQSYGDSITFSYIVRGQEYQQYVTLTTVPLNWNNATSRLALLCTECDRRGYKLYLSRKPYFLCRVCQSLVYEAQTVHYGGLCYAYLRIMKEERKYHKTWKQTQERKKRRQAKRIF